MLLWLKKIVWMILILTLLALFFITYFLLVTKYYPSISDSGSFGDMFGAISAVFSGLAFMGVVYTILLQRKELKNATKAQEKAEQMTMEQIMSLEKTARLNAYNAKLQSLGSSLLAVTIGNYAEPHKRDGINAEIEKIKQEITKEIEKK